ncbi:MAG: lipid-A-disaccharide synthase [Phycisphaerales bacterium]|nr:MAG: lipid-A-disaccharide synthase [Phycisphaerales bacterium]
MSGIPQPDRATSQPCPASHPRVLISALEPSADLHGASLIREVSRILPQVRFVGLGGPRMREAGAHTLDDLTAHASMLLGTLRLVGRALRLLHRLDRLMSEQQFDLGLVIDSPTLHLPLAGRMKRHGLPVLYYIAPQTWAWAEYRHRKVARRVDRAAVILPFEEEYFRSRGIRADYVGHPLFDVLAAHTVDAELVSRLRRGGEPVVTLLPGSRRHVVQEVLPGQLEVCRQLARRFKQARFLLSLAGEPVRPAVHTRVTGCGLQIEIQEGRNPELITAADLVLVASGTATLEVAYYRKPMIVMYNHSRWAYELIGRWLIATPWLSLPNIIAGRQIVPEFMPYYRSADPIAAKAAEMLSAPQTLERVSRQLDELMTPLIKTGASANTARIVAEMLQRSVDPSPDRQTSPPPVTHR